MRKHNAFTLVELLMSMSVMSVIGLAIAVVGVAVSPTRGRANVPTPSLFPLKNREIWPMQGLVLNVQNTSSSLFVGWFGNCLPKVVAG